MSDDGAVGGNGAVGGARPGPPRRRPARRRYTGRRRARGTGRVLVRAASIAAVVVASSAFTTGHVVDPHASGARPNIVFVLTDDLARNLVTKQFMPNLAALEQQGTTFTNYFVADSLCCPSRATIFTGRFPHDTGVFTNRGPNGGYRTFNRHGDQRSTIATDLHAAGYRTAMMGKYLNRYHPSDPPAPGWDTWDVADWGYPEYNYSLNDNGKVVHYGGPNVPGKDNYLTDVLSGFADSFVSGSVARHPTKPFFLEVATFAPHAPYTPAPRYANLYPHLAYPRTPAFGAKNTAAPAWLRNVPALSAKDRSSIATAFRRRAQAVKSVDDLIGNLVSTLRSTGALANTYFVFSSDNGLHMGEHRLMPGKLTAFDTDIHVPLIVVGPRVPPGTSVTSFAENVDLRPTFDALAGLHPGEPVDGRSLAPLIFGAGPGARAPAGWRQGVYVEHMGPVSDAADDPDRPDRFSGNPTSYIALRLRSALYVQYGDGEHEYYDLRRDPYELHNVYASLPASRKAALRAEALRLKACHDRPACSDVRAVV